MSTQAAFWAEIKKKLGPGGDASRSPTPQPAPAPPPAAPVPPPSLAAAAPAEPAPPPSLLDRAFMPSEIVLEAGRAISSEMGLTAPDVGRPLPDVLSLGPLAAFQGSPEARGALRGAAAGLIEEGIPSQLTPGNIALTLLTGGIGKLGAYSGTLAKEATSLQRLLVRARALKRPMEDMQDLTDRLSQARRTLGKSEFWRRLGSGVEMGTGVGFAGEGVGTLKEAVEKGDIRLLAQGLFQLAGGAVAAHFGNRGMGTGIRPRGPQPGEVPGLMQGGPPLGALPRAGASVGAGPQPPPSLAAPALPAAATAPSAAPQPPPDLVLTPPPDLPPALPARQRAARTPPPPPPDPRQILLPLEAQAPPPSLEPSPLSPTSPSPEQLSLGIPPSGGRVEPSGLPSLQPPRAAQQPASPSGELFPDRAAPAASPPPGSARKDLLEGLVREGLKEARAATRVQRSGKYFTPGMRPGDTESIGVYTPYSSTVMEDQHFTLKQAERVMKKVKAKKALTREEERIQESLYRQADPEGQYQPFIEIAEAVDAGQLSPEVWKDVASGKLTPAEVDFMYRDQDGGLMDSELQMREPAPAAGGSQGADLKTEAGQTYTPGSAPPAAAAVQKILEGAAAQVGLPGVKLGDFFKSPDILASASKGEVSLESSLLEGGGDFSPLTKAASTVDGIIHELAHHQHPEKEALGGFHGKGFAKTYQALLKRFSASGDRARWIKELKKALQELEGSADATPEPPPTLR